MAGLGELDELCLVEVAARAQCLDGELRRVEIAWRDLVVDIVRHLREHATDFVLLVGRRRGEQPLSFSFDARAFELAEQRGQALSAFFLACYAGLVIPVVGVGVISGFTGTFTAVLIFSILLAVLCLFSIFRFTRVASIGGAR